MRRSVRSRTQQTHVLYVANGTTVGGGSRVIGQLITGLDTRFATELSVPGKGALFDWAQLHGRSVSVTRTGGRGAVFGRGAALRHALELLPAARHAHIVHAESQTCYPGAAIAARVTGAKRVCHVQFPACEEELSWCLRAGVEAVIAVYDAQAREIRAAMPNLVKVEAIPNGIELERYTPLAEGERDQAWRFGRRHVAVVVGKLAKVKGYTTLIQAAREMHRDRADFVILCVGDEDPGSGYRSVLEQLTLENGVSDVVRFIGWQDDVRPVLQSADVFVLPSYAEGLPLAILEAMATALPVVATSINGIPDAVADGETGLLVHPGDANRLASALRSLFDSQTLARSMGWAGRKRVEAKFSVERVVRKVEDLYDELLST